MPSPYRIVLSGQEEAVLAGRARSVRWPYRDRLRAAIVLAAAAGQTSAAITAELGVCTDTVRKWRHRLAAGRLPGLADAPRSGRLPVFTAADRVFWIVDSGSSHRGAASVERMARAWPNAQLIHLPAHASWLDQAELYFFSVVQRKVLTPNDFTGLDQIRDRLAAFETRYNAIAKPFTWKFTRADLSDLLRRIDARDKTQPHALASMISTPDELTGETTKPGIAPCLAPSSACRQRRPASQPGGAGHASRPGMASACLARAA
jgi:hypothetical protein